MRLATDEARRLFPGLPYKIPRWITGPFVAGDGGRKLRRWLESAPAPPWPDEGNVVEIEKRLRFQGDPAALTFLAVAIAKLPLPVRDYAAARVQFVGMGIKWGGSCGVARTVDESRPYSIVVTPGHRHDGSVHGVIAEFQRVAAHEIAHAWLEAEPSPGARGMEAVDQGVFQTPTPAMAALCAEDPEIGRRLARWQEKQRAREKPVERLCWAWGFRRTTGA